MSALRVSVSNCRVSCCNLLEQSDEVYLGNPVEVALRIAHDLRIGRVGYASLHFSELSLDSSLLLSQEVLLDRESARCSD